MRVWPEQPVSLRIPCSRVSIRRAWRPPTAERGRPLSRRRGRMTDGGRGSPRACSLFPLCEYWEREPISRRRPGMRNPWPPPTTPLWLGAAGVVPMGLLAAPGRARSRVPTEARLARHTALHRSRAASPSRRRDRDVLDSAARHRVVHDDHGVPAGDARDGASYAERAVGLPAVRPAAGAVRRHVHADVADGTEPALCSGARGRRTRPRDARTPWDAPRCRRCARSPAPARSPSARPRPRRTWAA